MKTVFNGLNLNWDKEGVIVKNSLYFKRLTKLMRESGYQTIRSFQWWKIFSYLAPFTTSKFRTPQRKTGPKWKDCAEGVTQIFGMAIGHEYVTKYFEKNQKEKVVEMVTNIKSAFKDRVKSRNWMDEATKKVAMEKIDAVSAHVGFPNWLFVPGKIEEYYQSLNVVDGEWFTSMINIHVFVHHLKNKKLAEQAHSLYGVQSPVTVNAFYSIDSNSITIPAAILRPPLYGLGLAALNYGAIGTIIGHELIHGFDDRGRHRDLNGNQKQWWTNESVAEFNKRKQCLIEQISQYSYKIADTKYKVNGEVTQGENIADNGGIHVALHAYDLVMARRKQSQLEDPDNEPSLSGLTGFSNRQLFFLSFANVMCKSLTDYAKKALLKDEHNLSEFRVLGALSNMREFAEAWNCPVGSKMNPANKCVLW
ncbi:endothelin-converting enzyme homolog [Cloeon dipterum]|uniref:endothelin-converting enzyme homolog n=1 Tax=Cloeon dipterum TaxID=197152 RepID=UPI0032203F6C